MGGITHLDLAAGIKSALGKGDTGLTGLVLDVPVVSDMGKTSARRIRPVHSPWFAPIVVGVAGIVGVGAMGAMAYIDENSWIPTDHPAIRYFEGTADDPVAKLQERLERGETKLDFDTHGWGYLPSLLQHLGVNPDSQMLVFSKTSFQASRISADSPRALYFNDAVAVGYVPNGDVLELVALDSRQGVNFYTLDIKRSVNPGFARRDVCLQCHAGPATLGVPGILISSVYPGPSGLPFLRAGAHATDDRTPLDKRWGGWYVTGTTGSQRHMGNAFVTDPNRPDVLELAGTQNLTSLARKVDTTRYLRSTSDIVALMTYEHQTRMTNLMTRIGWETRVAVHEHKLDTPSVRAHLDAITDELVTYMLFADETPLREPVAGVSTFTKTFPVQGPRDKRGRSLRDFDLQTRLFKYPLSYMIYSAAFDGIPDEARGRIYRRLHDVLTGRDRSDLFKRLSTEDRRNLLEIVRDTKAGLPGYWQESTERP
jgi:hypothetical protein